jgi:hypothetical protein
MFANKKSYKSGVFILFELRLNTFVVLLIYWLPKSCSNFTSNLRNKYEFWYLFENKWDIVYIA